MLFGVDINAVVAVGSLIVAGISMILNHGIVQRQVSLQKEHLKNRMDGEVLMWGERAIDCMADAELVAQRTSCATSGADLDLELRTRAQALSAIADRGRMFFPNEYPDAQGADRAGAYRGERPPILDAIVFSYFQLHCLCAASPQTRAADAAAAEQFIADCRRVVVTEMQNAIDPRYKRRMLRTLRQGREGGEQTTHDLAKTLGIEFDARYPNHPGMKSWINTHVNGMYPRSELRNDLKSRLLRGVNRFGRFLVRASAG